MSKIKTGLVLEGGAMRGIYTAGVLDVFLEHGFHFDSVMGVSAGAIHGCSFVSGQIGRSIRYYRKYVSDKRFMSFHNLLRTGDLVDEKFCYHEIPESLDVYDFEAFGKTDTKFYGVCTNLETGRAEYIHITDMKKEIDVVRASASMPFVSRIVNFNGKKLLDGGCSDSIPVIASRKLGNQKNVVVLTRHEGYEKKPTNIKPAKILYRKYPKFIHALADRHIVYNQTLKFIREKEAAGELFVIRPQIPLMIGRMSHDINEIQATYDQGRKDALARIDELKQWMELSQDA